MAFSGFDSASWASAATGLFCTQGQFARDFFLQKNLLELLELLELLDFPDHLHREAGDDDEVMENLVMVSR
jgi:hypothetical protein